MVNTMAFYMEKEAVLAEADALEYIASVSDGAMRDALSILDQCLSLYAGETITLSKVQSLLGAVDQSALFAYSDALVKNNSDAALTIIAEVAKEGRDLSRFTADIIIHFRNLLVAAQISNHVDILDYAAETVERYRTQGKAIDPTILINYIREFSELQNQLRYSAQERLALEVCTIKLCNQNLKPWGVHANSPAETEAQPPLPFLGGAKRAEDSISVVKPVVQPEEVMVATPDSIPETSVFEEAAPVAVSSRDQGIADRWPDFCGQLSGLLKSLLSLCKVECGEGGGITIICRDQGSLQYVKDQKTQITEALIKYFQLPEEPLIVFSVNEGYNNADAFKESMSSQINMQVEFE